MRKVFSAAAFVLLATTATLAQVLVPVRPAPQANQRARIRQGVATGNLTPAEAARMRSREAGITAEKRAARADGVVTPGERHDIRKTEQRTSRAIYRQKHDAQVR